MAFVPNVNWVNDEPPGFEADEMIRMQLGIADAHTIAQNAATAGLQAALDASEASTAAAAAQATADDALALVESVDSGLIHGADGRTYALLSCALRNDGGATWAPIDDTGHRPSGVLSVETLADRIVVHHDFTAVRVSSVQVTPDETLSGMGISCGASVGLDQTRIHLYSTPDGLGDYVYYDGTAWQSFAGVFSGFTWYTNPGRVRLEHAPVGEASAPMGSATGRDGGWNVGLGGMAQTYTDLTFHNVGGTGSPSAPASTMKAWVQRFGRTDSAPLDPATINPTNGNLWVTGLFEIAG